MIHKTNIKDSKTEAQVNKEDLQGRIPAPKNSHYEMGFDGGFPTVRLSASEENDPDNEKPFPREQISRHFLSEEDRDFIGKNADKYEKKFQRKYISWNWCAFLVSGFWLLYRKMYGWFFIFLAAGFISSLIINFTTTAGTTEPTPAAIAIVCANQFVLWGLIPALFADPMYKAHIHRAKIKSETTQDFIKRGGVNKLAVCVLAAIVLLFILLITASTVYTYVTYLDIMDEPMQLTI